MLITPVLIYKDSVGDIYENGGFDSIKNKKVTDWKIMQIKLIMHMVMKVKVRKMVNIDLI